MARRSAPRRRRRARRSTGVLRRPAARQAAAELAGIRRAQRAAEAAMDSVPRACCASAGPRRRPDRRRGRVRDVGGLRGATGRAPTTSSSRRPRRAPSARHGLRAILFPRRAVVVDIWPRDNESFMFCDMTRTFVVGEGRRTTCAKWHALCKESLDAADRDDQAWRRRPRDVDRVVRGVRGRRRADPAHEDGRPDARRRFFHGLGHGVGLEVHRGSPGWGSSSKLPFKAGDVVTVEPGCYRQGYGGIRLGTSSS